VSVIDGDSANVGGVRHPDEEQRQRRRCQTLTGTAPTLEVSVIDERTTLEVSVIDERTTLEVSVILTVDSANAGGVSHLDGDSGDLQRRGVRH
jgi:hypothetical protein